MLLLYAHLFCSLFCSELQSKVEFEPGFTATSLVHPATYLNKILVSSSEGSLQLWNIRTQYAHSHLGDPHSTHALCPQNLYP